ncbi:MAG: HEAT repeat domain-containing protein [Phycisphaerales bacterium]|nr:HEAT repeat domain-containing protein [Phycisphaerales bacterium]
MPHQAHSTPPGLHALVRSLPVLAAIVCTTLAAELPAQTLPGPPIQRLTDPAATPEAALAVAGELLAEPPGVVAAAELLATDHTSPGVRALLLAVAQMAAPPNALLPGAIAVARDAQSPLRAEAASALGAFRSREAAAALVELISEDHIGTLRDEAFRALARLSCRDDLGQDGDAWRDWLKRVVTLGDRQWEQELLARNADRVLRLTNDVRTSHDRLVEAWRQIHLLTPLEGRSALLVSLLNNPVPELRDLGFDLVNREVGESRVLQPIVGEAAIALLKHESPTVRAQAALLLNRLAPPEAEAPVLAALDREADPRAADALLLAATRWPSSRALPPVLRWLAGPAAVRTRAVATAWSLLRNGFVEQDSDREAVLAAVRLIPANELTPSASRILATLGGPDDLERLRGLLGSADPALKAAAAEALGLRADQVDALLTAATTDASLFEATARAVRTHMHDARGYAALSALPTPSLQDRERVLADYVSSLPTPELVRLARLTSTATEAARLLKPLMAADRQAGPVEDLAEGLSRLARAQLQLGNPSDALDALSLIPSPQTTLDPAGLEDTRVTALLWLNRIDAAKAAQGSPDAWLDGLEHAITEPHAPAIVDEIERRFETELSPEQESRFDVLRQRLAQAINDSGGAEGG